MGIAAVVAVFATENVVEILVSTYIQLEMEAVVWGVIAVISAAVVYEVGDERGDW